MNLTCDQTDEVLESLELVASEETKENGDAYERLKVRQKQYKIANVNKIREYQKQYRANNKEKFREYQIQYRTDNAKMIREAKKQHYIQNADQLHEKQKEYRSRPGYAEYMHAYSKQYRADNADKLREQKKQYRAGNPDKIRKQKQQSLAKKIEKDQKGTWLKKAFRAARCRAKKRGLPYDEEFPDLDLPDACPVLGILLVYPKVNAKRSNNSPSLDRINPLLGYVASNLRVISFRANALKNDASVEELRAVIRYMEGEL